MRNLGVVAIGMLMLVACSQIPSAQATPQRLASGSQIVYGPAPTDCPSGLQPETIAPFKVPVIGKPPLWASGFAADVPAPVPATRYPLTPHGIPFKVFWLTLSSATSSAIRVSIMETTTRSLAWIATNRGEGTEAVFDPAKPDQVEAPVTPGQPEALGYPSTVAITRPGCYEIHAYSVSAEWRSVFAAGTNGRLPSPSL